MTKKNLFAPVSLLSFLCLLAARSASPVAVSTDKAVYNRKVRVAAGYGYGEAIRIRVVNRGRRDLFFHAGTVIPFTSLYLEMFRDKKWSFQNRLHGVAELPARYSSEEWLKTATRLKPGEKFDFLYKIEYSKDMDPYKAGKYRFKLDYCFALSGPNDWLKRDEVSGEIPKKIFETVYSDPFRLK